MKRERGFFERRGREVYAENAEVIQRNKAKRKPKKKIKVNTKRIHYFLNFLFIFPCLLLRPLRNLRALCVQKIPAFPPSQTTI